MDKCIDEAKNIIKEQVKEGYSSLFGALYSKYSKTYYSTNELLRYYLELVDFEGKDSALTVTSSGDHTFNLVCKGIKNVDTFDTNRLTEYFAFGIKRAMILKYGYKDFRNVILSLKSDSVNFEYINSIIEGLFPYMESHHKKYWQEIINYNYCIQKEYRTNLNLFELLCFKSLRTQFGYNNYMANKEMYEKLRSNLQKANITFSNVSALTLKDKFNKKYDFILLSNILDYVQLEWGREWEYQKLIQYERDLKKLANDDCVVFLHYLYDRLSNPFRTPEETPVFRNSAVFLKDITDEKIFELCDTKTKNRGEILLKRFK